MPYHSRRIQSLNTAISRGITRPFCVSHCLFINALYPSCSHLRKEIEWCPFCHIGSSILPWALRIRTSGSRSRRLPAASAGMRDMRDTLLVIVATFTSLLAVINTICIFTHPDGVTLWNASRFLVSVYIVGIGILTWRHVLVHMTQGTTSSVLFVCSVALLSLGIAGTGLAIYNGQRSGDTEYYLFPVHWLFVGQGMLTLWYLRRIGSEPSVTK